MTSRSARRGKVTSVAGVLAIGLVAAACLDDSVTGTRPLSLSIVASPSTATVGQPIDFEYVATGTGLGGLILDYGDGVADTVTFLGPVEAEGFLTHEYQAAGTYTARGEITAFAGIESTTLVVTVN